MVIKNEAGRYLRKVLEEHRNYIDEAVIVDDGSADNSAGLCEEILKDIPLHMIRNTVSKFSNEIELRKQQWNETIKTNPDWILNLDADEMFETKFREEVRSIINQTGFDVVSFRLYDFWDDIHYRDDIYWIAHKIFTPFLIRYNENFEYRWKETPQHCGRFPYNINILPTLNSALRLKHFGWANASDRIEKYNRYMALDPGAKYGSKAQYASILDETPNLAEWRE